MAPAFDRSEEFAFDKPGCAACPNLAPDDWCRIHDRLEPEGFRGCVLFDCLGAGQRVVQELYAGRSWREEPELLPVMWRALKALRDVHEQVLVLQAAAKLPLLPDELAMIESLRRELEPEGGWTSDSLAVHGSQACARAAAFLRSLSRHFPA